MLEKYILSSVVYEKSRCELGKPWQETTLCGLGSMVKLFDSATTSEPGDYE